MWQFWIDRGGTFTDIVARAPDGTLKTAKLLSEDPVRLPDATVAGIRKILDLAPELPIPFEKIAEVRIGTTVATNALLERKGEPTLLLVNQGLQDVLRIGTQQRPRLFDRAIRLPEQLYSRAAGIAGRISATGEVLVELDLNAARQILETAFQEGFRSVSIALAHSFRFPEHENRLAELARSIGFEQISTSYEASGLIKLVPRGQTAVVDAYLSPILRRYIAQVQQELPGVRIRFMQSNGGLAEASVFRGRNAILSGPAGGVVGAVKAGRAAGVSRIVGFDMGGTSTDVSHFAGEYERAMETEISGISIRAAMLRVHTVAAGGGSICHFDGTRFHVGPSSAGAEPGPACYRKGGPLTVTDCNVALGRLQPDLFPKVFGPNGDAPIDRDVVFIRLRNLCAELPGWNPLAIAEGFLRVAVDNMVNAIKKITLARGHDPRGYTLVAFGGAAGQHAAAVADGLEIERILVPRLAGVLSAYGIGTAEIRALRQKTIEKALQEPSWAMAESEFSLLERAAAEDLSKETLLSSQVTRRAYLRYEGSDSSIAVEATTVSQAAEIFRQRHLSHYGFVMPERALILESIEVEMIGEPPPATFDWKTDASREQKRFADVTFQGAARRTPVYRRDELIPGIRIEGPAIIVESHATTVVEPSWSAELVGEGDLIMERSRPRAAIAQRSGAVNPVLLELFNNLFVAVGEQMGVVLQNTAYSVNIKERLDYSCAIFDRAGRLIANAPHIPVHLGSMSAAVQTIISNRGHSVQAGDAYLLNDPYAGGTHLPDLTVVSPVFCKTLEPVFWVASRGHHADVGGCTPGSMPPFSRTLQEEGVLIRDCQLLAGGVLQEEAFVEVMKKGQFPARNIRQNLGDVQAQLAANARGAQEMQLIAERYGIATVEAYTKHVFDNAAKEVRSIVSRLKPGRFIQRTDTGAEIHVHVDREAGRAKVDFTGTSAQQPDNTNAPSAIVRAVVLYVFRTLIDRDIPLNDGCLEPIQIIVPSDCMLNPQWPAAVVAGNVETSQALANALFGAMRIMAASQGTMNNLTFGNPQYQYYETICGGAGAGPGFPGASAVHTHMTNSRLTDLEILELRYPVLVEEFRIREGSGGNGRWKGGDGVVRKIVFREPMQAAILSSSRVVPPFGLNGGQPGAPGRNRIIRAAGQIEELAACAQVHVAAGDAIVIETPGGGGFSVPQRRRPRVVSGSAGILPVRKADKLEAYPTLKSDGRSRPRYR